LIVLETAHLDTDTAWYLRLLGINQLRAFEIGSMDAAAFLASLQSFLLASVIVDSLKQLLLSRIQLTYCLFAALCTFAAPFRLHDTNRAVYQHVVVFTAMGFALVSLVLVVGRVHKHFLHRLINIFIFVHSNLHLDALLVQIVSDPDMPRLRVLRLDLVGEPTHKVPLCFSGPSLFSTKA